MAGAVVITTSKIDNAIGKYEVTWISDASGDVSGSVFAMMSGTIIAVEFIPDSGLTQPTTLYDVDLLDAEGVTMFDDGSGSSIGTNLSNAAASHHVPLVGLTGVTIYRRWHHGGDVQLTVAGAGDTNSGVVNIYVKSGVV